MVKMENLTNNDQKYIKHVVLDLIDRKNSFNFVYDTSIVNGEEGIECTGTYGNNELNVAYRNDKDIWLAVLAHEYNHLCQEKENSYIHRKNNSFKYKNYVNAVEVYFNWVGGKRIPLYVGREACDIVQELELDCEMRTFETIKKWKLSVNNEWFIKKANTYIYWYSLSKKYKGIWFDLKKPYNVKKLYKDMPDKFMNIKEYANIPDHYERHALMECTIDNEAFQTYLDNVEL